jgi:galactokinase
MKTKKTIGCPSSFCILHSDFCIYSPALTLPQPLPTFFPMPANYDAVKKQFTETFGSGGTLHVVRSPGRVNLIGEHTDYNDGFVFPMAIEPNVTIVFRARTDGKVRLASTIFPEEIAEFSLTEKIAPGDPPWANYSKGITYMLVESGVSLVGMDAMFSNTLPMGGGLSSSAALEVGTGRALLSLAKTDVTGSNLLRLPPLCSCRHCTEQRKGKPTAGSTLHDYANVDPQQALALMAQRAEHEFAGTPSGIMDQTIVSCGKAGSAMLMDCRDLSKQFIPIDPKDLRVVIVNSMVKHELSGGEYAERRAQCEEGVAYFQKHYPGRNIRALRDVDSKQIETAGGEGKLDAVVYRRCRHVVGEIARATQAAKELIARKFERVGELMVQSHNSLRDDYEVSTEELDYLVEESMTIKGVYGARMTGGGFGGCIVALVKPDRVDALTSHLNTVYPKNVGKKPEIYVTTATDGAKVVE